jgi:lipopolysaccharide export system permease protein
MKILDRHIGTVIIIHVAVVLAVLVGLDSFFALLRELDDIGRGRYDNLEVMLYLILTLPQRIYEFFPMAGLIGTMLGLGNLASNNELTVIRASGVSIGRIVISVMKTAVLMMILVVIIGELIAPYADQYAKSRRSIAISDQITLKTRYGFWARDNTSYINIRSIQLGGLIGDINIFEFDDNHKLRIATHANQAIYEGNKWILLDIVQSQITDKGVSNQRIERAEWNSLLSPALLNAVVVNPSQMPIWDLNRYVRFLKDNGQNAEQFELAFWIKVFTPLALLVMIFLATPFVFGQLRSVSVGQRIMVGLIFGISFYILNQMFNHLGLAYDFSPFMSAVIPSLAFLILAVVLLRRVQ